MEKFIENVRAHPCLWNPIHPDYRDVQVKVQAWQEVVKQSNSSSISNIKVARIEWRKLRDNHREALRRAKLGQNRLLPPQITTWKYAKAMQFLEPYSKYRITENIEFDPPAEQAVKNCESDISNTEAADNNGYSNHSEGRKRRCIDCSKEAVTVLQPEHGSDALESFFNCILASTREMPPWMQTQVKKKIFSVIIEAEECLSSQNHGTHNHGDNYTMIVSKIKTEKDF